jgi:hypothetical protein
MRRAELQPLAGLDLDALRRGPGANPVWVMPDIQRRHNQDPLVGDLRRAIVLDFRIVEADANFPVAVNIGGRRVLLGTLHMKSVKPRKTRDEEREQD